MIRRRAARLCFSLFRPPDADVASNITFRSPPGSWNHHPARSVAKSEALRGVIVQTAFEDLRYGLRLFRKNPGFTIVAGVALALGIGANTAIFSVVNGVLLRPLPYPEPDRLVMIYEKTQEFDHNSVAYPNFLDWRRENRSFEDMAAFRGDDFNFTGMGQPEHL